MPTTPRHAPQFCVRLARGLEAGHRLRPVAIIAIITVVTLIVAAESAVIIVNNAANRPRLAPRLPPTCLAMAAAAEAGNFRPTDPPDDLAAMPRRRTAARGLAVMLTSNDAIDIGQGISINPAPGWSPEYQGPNWVMLVEADGFARMYVRVGPGSQADVVTDLTDQVRQVLREPSSGLSNVFLGEPKTQTLQSAKFQQAAYIDYLADVSTRQGTVIVIGAFGELLNTSNQLSAFIDFRQNGDASDQAAIDGRTMIDSMI
ncbi:hypothetical protein [Mycobacterium kansasii]|uniref:hypothetical protein n=1 Tax=Mycobacterium kansasii TaxID=1768 RepID=UPI0012D2A926|nr:hypothetical protein [Mycobacterium kansasii]